MNGTPGRLSWLALALLWSCSSEPKERAQPASSALAEELRSELAARAKAIEAKLIGWRRDIHEHPELGEQEHRTSKLVAEHLKRLGLEVRTGIAKTGVVGVLKGGALGPVVALRADMDALPVQEESKLAFASKAKGKYLGKEVHVMHACGHDAHTAILMAVAEVLAGMKAKLPGTVAFYFQPAEEGPSEYVPSEKSSWGAKRMIEEGAMRSPEPDAVFGLHVFAGGPAGRISYRSGATMASSDDLRVRITGAQTHAGRPWAGIDPITVSAQVIVGLQTIVSRQTDISRVPTVVSLGTIHGGVRPNIIPEHVDMAGTIRSYDEKLREETHRKVERTITGIAESGGAKAEVKILKKYDTTINDAALTSWARPSLVWAADGDVVDAPLTGGAEDFSFMANEAKGLFFFLGATSPSLDMSKAASNHSPRFEVDESTLLTGVRALAVLATDFLTRAEPAP